MPFKIVRNDITKMNVDAIVNTANKNAAFYSGIDFAVYKAAGEEALLEERRKIGKMKIGEAAVTPGFDLPAKYIIHTVSPAYKAEERKNDKLLRDCYKNCLKLAKKNNCSSIAFPLLATGNLGYPKEISMRIALDEINKFLLKNEMLIFLVVFGERETKIGLNIYPDLEEYIDNNYVEKKISEEYPCGVGAFRRKKDTDSKERSMMASTCDGFETFYPNIEEGNFSVDECKRLSNEASIAECCAFHEEGEELDSNALDDEEYDEGLLEERLKERMSHMTDTFQEFLMYLIESKNLSKADVYKNAIVTKQVFSKIKLNPNYHPDKSTAMRLCVGARLNLDETKDLLARAGYALSPCDKRDIIFSFFIENGVFDMIEIDLALEEHGLPCFIA